MNASIVPLPEEVRITDITCTDGLRGIAAESPLATRKRVLSALVGAGVQRVEAANFAAREDVARMGDAKAVLRHAKACHPGIEAICRVSSRHAAFLAYTGGATGISFVISASAPHNKVCVDRSHEESLAELAGVAEDHPGAPITLFVPVAFGCPLKGEVPARKVAWLMTEGIRRGASAVTLCDTLGVANPLQLKVLVEHIREEYPDLDLGVRLHDTFGMGMANAMAALESGIDRLETAAGGLGGPEAARNIPTEDLVNMLHRMGVRTGVDLSKYLKVLSLAREYSGLPLPGHGASVKKYSGRLFFSPARI